MNAWFPLPTYVREEGGGEGSKPEWGSLEVSRMASSRNLPKGVTPWKLLLPSIKLTLLSPSGPTGELAEIGAKEALLFWVQEEGGLNPSTVH